MSGIFRVLAIAVAVVAGLALPVALVAHDIGQVVFSQEKMTQIVGDRLAASDDLRHLLVTGFLSNPAPESSNAGDFSLARAARSLSPEQTQELANLLLPEDWFREQIASVIGGLYVWLDGEQPRPRLALDLRPLKERLLSGGAQQLMLLLIDSWPQCLSDQLADIEQGLRSTRPPPILYCKPPSSLRGVYTERSTAWFTNQVRVMPDTISLTGERTASPDGPDLSELRHQIWLVRDVMRYSWMVPASLFGLIMALAVRSWLGLSRWWGAAITAAGFVSLLLIPFARPLETRLLREVRPSQALPPVLTDALASAAGGIRTAAVQALAAQAILLILVGAALLVGGWLLSRRHSLVRATAASGPVPAGTVETLTGPDEPSESPTGIFG